MNISETELKYTSGVYSKRPLAIVRGLGAHVWDDAGREYIDCVGGQGSANVGHANPAVAEAIAEQARRLISCISVRTSAAVAPPTLTMKFACCSDTIAPPTRRPLRPTSSMSRPA